MNEYLDDEPMGPLDAIRRDNLEESFVNVGELLAGVSPSTESLLGKAVIAGGKGAGKTHLIRHLEYVSKAAGRTTIYCNLTLDLVDQIRHLRGDMAFEDTIRLWMNIWRFVINRALVGFILENSGSSKMRKAIARASFLHDYGDSVDTLKVRLSKYLAERHGTALLAGVRSPDPQSSLLKVIDTYKSSASMSSAFSTFDFSALESDLSSIITTYGPVHFLVDGLDEFSPNSPMDWLDFQVGLFLKLFLAEATRDYARNIFVTVTLRDYVYHQASRHVHADRVGSSVLPLIWGPASAEEFLNRRFWMARTKNFAFSGEIKEARPLASWLGFETITGSSRQRAEPVERYILRHSRYSPRNIVMAVNRLCRRQNDLSRTGERIGPDQLRSEVRELAIEFGDYLLRNAAEEVMSLAPVKARSQRDAVRRLAAREYLTESVKDVVKDAIARCEEEITQRQTLRDALKESCAAVFAEQDSAEIVKVIEGVLWRTGIIAYADAGVASGWRFVWTDGAHLRPEISPDIKLIAYHSSMIEVCGLKASKDGPAF